MLTDARTLTSGQVIRADVCVVGSGPAGMTVAMELERRTDASVLLLESGGPSFDAANTDLNAGEAAGLLIDGAVPPFPLSLEGIRARVVGGSSALWGGYCRPFRAIDFEDKPYQDVAGWPIGMADLAPYLAIAHDYSQLGPVDFDQGTWAGILGLPRPLSVPELEPTVVQRRSVSWGPTYTPHLTASSQITLLTYANLVHLAAAGGGGHVDSGLVRTLTGVELTVEATIFVLAMGGIEVPRILLASNDVASAGIGNEHDQVGRYFGDNIGSMFALVVLEDTPEDLALYNAVGNVASTASPNGTPTEILVHSSLDLADSIRRSEGLPMARLDLIVLPATDAPGDVQSVPPSVRHVVDLFKASPNPARSVAVARGYCEQIVQPSSRVTLIPAVDAVGVPRVRVDWNVPTDQHDLMRRAYTRLAEVLGAHGLGRVQSTYGWISSSGGSTTISPTGDTMGSATGMLPIEHTYHQLCTARMSADPADGVVDADLRVHEVDNLYVASSAAFSLPSGEFPTLNLIALSARLADHLATAVLT